MSARLFLGRLPDEVTEDEIRELFSKFGEITEFNLKKNYGFLTFEEESAGTEAIKEMDGYAMGNDNIVVQVSKPKREFNDRRGGDRGGYGDRQGSYDSRPVKCFNCQKEGHKSYECSEPKNDSRQGGYGGDRGGDRGGYGNRPTKCFNCQQEGHKSFECSEPKKERQGGYGGDRGGDRGPQKCFNCQQEGHKSYECSEPKKDRDGYRGRSNY
eukprot:NODE_553_length_6771_cov_0.191847.p4 type:complete len:212 gc:universal NODE_553_length_6771_cov_0.191847:3278-3913(+)